MPYATPQDMEALFGLPVLVQLTGRGSNALDTAVLEQALGDADSLINGYLAPRYALPLTGYRAPVRQACDIAMYYLLGTKIHESAQTRYDQAVAYLRDIARGLASLEADGSVAPEGDRQAADVAMQCAGDRVFSAETLRDY